MTAAPGTGTRRWSDASSTSATSAAADVAAVDDAPATDIHSTTHSHNADEGDSHDIQSTQDEGRVNTRSAGATEKQSLGAADGQFVTSLNVNNTPDQDLHTTTRSCWICFSEDDPPEDIDGSPIPDDNGRSSSRGARRWVQACRCLNSMRFVHESCLLRWIAKKESAAPGEPVCCPACLYPYTVVEDDGVLLILMDAADRLINRVMPIIGIACLGITVYVVQTTYGAYAVVAVAGSTIGDAILGGEYWGWRVWVGLPLLPVALILSRLSIVSPAILPSLPFLVMRNDQINFSRWPLSPASVITLVPFVRMAYYTTCDLLRPLLNPWLGPVPTTNGQRIDVLDIEIDGAHAINVELREEAEDEEGRGVVLGRRDGLQLVLGALLMPAICSATGSLLSFIPWVRRTFPDTLSRNVFGGGLFVLCKDICSTLFRIQKRRARRSRRIRECVV